MNTHEIDGAKTNIARPAKRALRGEIEQLRTELAEMAFALDRRGRAEAADVAMTISARLEEICEGGEGDGAAG